MCVCYGTPSGSVFRIGVLIDPVAGSGDCRRLTTKNCPPSKGAASFDCLSLGSLRAMDGWSLVGGSGGRNLGVLPGFRANTRGGRPSSRASAQLLLPPRSCSPLLSQPFWRGWRRTPPEPSRRQVSRGGGVQEDGPLAKCRLFTSRRR